MKETVISKKITYSIVAVLLIVLVTIGATYAYFSAQASTDVQTVTTGTLTMGFTNGDIVRADGILPIDDSEIKSKATELPFSITNTGNEHMNITIKLTDITIADDLKDVDFRWGLYNADTGKGISFGILNDAVTGGEELLYRDSIIDAGAPTKNYVLRIWIHDDGALQNEMQGETFSAKVTVTGEAIEYTPESCFTFNNGSITGYDVEKCGTDVVVPRTINGVTVTTIGLEAFQSKGLTSVIISNNVTEIIDYAFDGNTFSHITIPEDIKYLWESTIGTITSSIFMPEIQIYVGAISVDSPLKELIFSSSNNLSFGGMQLPENVSNIILMNGVTKIERYGFQNNLNLISIEIPSSVNEIITMDFDDRIESPFKGCINLETIIVRGKTSAPSTFAKDWNCITFDSNNTCTKYANVEYRP